ncbi:MAG: hypothetical protein HUK20_11415 [Fibrobacter sp.]|nr:hypothetical protein [Fibrobacter sp.]
MPRLLVILFVIICTAAQASDIYFDTKWTLWQDGEILIWTPDKESPIDAKEFCLSLRRANTGIGEPKCRLFGEWERDTIAMRYATWLNNNLEKGIPAEYLKARHPSMAAKLQTLEDRIVLFVADKEKTIQIAIFDETALTPKASGSVKKRDDKIALGDDIASSFFDRRTSRRLSKSEREKKMTEPDEFYKNVPDFRAWAGIGIGYSQAQIPLTPDNWTRSHTKSMVRNYRITKDSVSLWNFIDDSDPVYSIYFGGTWYGFIGGEIFYRYANHNVKTDPSDTVYQELDHWSFTQHEIGLNVMLSTNYTPFKWLDIHPFGFLGFLYSFYVEDIALKDGVRKPSKAYQSRIKFEDAYKGAIFGGGSQFVVLDNYGISVRTGISSRGKDVYSDPTPDAAAEPTTIGAITIDWFVSLGLEYHFN